MSVDLAASAMDGLQYGDAVLTSGEGNMRQILASRFSRASLNGFASILIVLAGVQAAPAITNDEAVTLCTQELMHQGSLAIHDIEVHHHDRVPYVYGNADFSDAIGVHFRCRVYHEKVRALRYLVKDPTLRKGRAWSKERPHGAARYDLQLDEAAKTPPPHDPATPHFQRVPQ